MRDRGTRNATFILKMLRERAIQYQRDAFMVFIDYKKEFDKVRDQDLFKMLKKCKLMTKTYVSSETYVTNK